MHNGNPCEFSFGGIPSKSIDRLESRIKGLKDRTTGEIQVKAFGSRTTGKYRPDSDLDIVVIVQNIETFESQRVQKIINSIKDDFLKETGVEVDINIIEPTDLPFMKFKEADFVNLQE